MGLFSGWFSGQSTAPEAQPATDWRREQRRKVVTAWPPVEARLGKERAQVLDMSDRGFGLALDESRAPGNTLVEIYQGDELLTRGFAMRTWGKGARVGYSFATGLTVERIQEKRAAQAMARAAKLLPTRVAAREAIIAASRKAQEGAEQQRRTLESGKEDYAKAVSYLDDAELEAIESAVAEAANAMDAAPKDKSVSSIRVRLKL